jgi:hypothetical protein
LNLKMRMKVVCVYMILKTSLKLCVMVSPIEIVNRITYERES